MIQTPRVSMLILMQNKLDEAIAFYTKIGLTLNFQIKDQWAEMELHGIKFGLAKTDTELPERRTGIILELDDLYTWRKEQEEQGIICSEPVERLHGIMASIKDPGNNILELYQPTPHKVHEMAEKMKSDK
ncbi:MAG: VOC family protein [Candidatus Babeliales bacterium]